MILDILFIFTCMFFVAVLLISMIEQYALSQLEYKQKSISRYFHDNGLSAGVTTAPGGNKIYHFDPECPSTLREPVRSMNKTLFYFRVLDAYRDKSGTKLHKLDLQCFQINEKAKLQIFKRNNL